MGYLKKMEQNRDYGTIVQATRTFLSSFLGQYFDKSLLIQISIVY